MKVRQDNRGKTPKVGDTIAYNPPYYKGLKIAKVHGFAKSGLPYLDNHNNTPKTGFVIVESAPEDFKNRKREVVTLTEQEARDVAYEDSHDFKTLKNEIVDTGRWTETHEIIVERVSDGKIFGSYYSQGLTEIQDQSPYEYDEPTFTEVFETTVLRTVYK